MIFICNVIRCITSTILSTALTTALPAIISDLNITITTGQWLTSGYSLVMGIMMPLIAFLITRFPTKKLYLMALGIFIYGLFLSIIATSFPLMIISFIFAMIVFDDVTATLSATNFKESASIHRLNVAFLSMRFVILLLLALAVFLVIPINQSCPNVN